MSYLDELCFQTGESVILCNQFLCLQVLTDGTQDIRVVLHQSAWFGRFRFRSDLFFRFNQFNLTLSRCFNQQINEVISYILLQINRFVYLLFLDGFWGSNLFYYLFGINTEKVLNL